MFSWQLLGSLIFRSSHMLRQQAQRFGPSPLCGGKGYRHGNLGWHSDRTPWRLQSYVSRAPGKTFEWLGPQVLVTSCDILRVCLVAMLSGLVHLSSVSPDSSLPRTRSKCGRACVLKHLRPFQLSASQRYDSTPRFEAAASWDQHECVLQRPLKCIETSRVRVG